MHNPRGGTDPVLSRPGPSRPRVGLVNAVNPVGLGLSTPLPGDYPDPDDSYSSDINWQQRASPIPANATEEQTHDDDEPHGEEDEEQEESGEDGGRGEGDDMSDTSSAMFDPEADPEGWARRLDELAGVLEIGEEEARAMRWGPAVGKRKEGR